jgi:hypothetical protein
VVLCATGISTFSTQDTEFKDMKRQFNFNVLIDEQQGIHVAHCLEMGLVAISEDVEELPAIMSKLIVRQIEFALKNDNPSDIYHPAPLEVWQKFRNAKREIESTKKSLSIWPGLTLGQEYVAVGC